MSVLALAWSYLRARPLGTLLNVLLLALGVGTIGFVVIVDRQVADDLDRNTRGIDLVVGAKGSPMQLILAGVFHLDAPTGNIPLAEAEALAKDPLIRRAIPLSLGDSFRGFRIVGTTPELIDLYGGKLAQGRSWNAPMEAVLGASVAADGGPRVGERIAGSHGLAGGGATHDEAAYTVVGVLAPTGTVLDRLVVVDLRSVWQVHEAHHHEEKDDDAEEREITMLLVQYASPLAAASLPRRINAQTNMRAAPRVRGRAAHRIIGVGADAIRAFGAVVLATASAVAVHRALPCARSALYDIAVLRTLGARRGRLPDAFAEARCSRHGRAGTAARARARRRPRPGMQGQPMLRIDPWAFHVRELWLLLPALVAAAAAASLPAWRAAHADIAGTLARRG
jgi:putative ABC transport system permease protein